MMMMMMIFDSRLQLRHSPGLDDDDDVDDDDADSMSGVVLARFDDFEFTYVLSVPISKSILSDTLRIWFLSNNCSSRQLNTPPRPPPLTRMLMQMLIRRLMLIPDADVDTDAEADHTDADIYAHADADDDDDADPDAEADQDTYREAAKTMSRLMSSEA